MLSLVNDMKNLWANLLLYALSLHLLTACNSNDTVVSGITPISSAVANYSVDKIANHTLIGAYLDQDGWDTDTIDQFNQRLTQPLSIINVFSNFDMDWQYLKHQSDNIVSRRAIPMISWMPVTGERPDDSLLREIATGNWDNYIDEWINGFRLWLTSYPQGQRPTIMIRFAHEFNSDWFPWSNQPERLISAWRHIHKRFVRAGLAGHVEWVWNVNNVDVDDHNDFSVYYPGDDVVDWVSIDGYNWGSNYHYSHWKSFDETFSQAYTKLVTDFPDKPVMIAEVSSAEPADLPNEAMGQLGDDSDAYENKAAWVSDMLVSVEHHYPAIKALLWFNSNKELSWALDAAHNTGLAAFNDGTSGGHYVTLESLNSEVARRHETLPSTTLPLVVGSDLLLQEAAALRALSKQQRSALRQAQFPRWFIPRPKND